MLTDLRRYPVPEWLKSLPSTSQPIPIKKVLERSVFYPACGLDGRPVKYFGGCSHSFVYADCQVAPDVLLAHLNTFKGYVLMDARHVGLHELLPKRAGRLPLRRTDGSPTDVHRGDFVPYAVWAVYVRREGFDDAHGPERFSLLYVGDEGVTTFNALYRGHRRGPCGVVLVRCDGFTGNWTAFCDPERSLARRVMGNRAGQPEYLLTCDSPGARWPWYSLIGHPIVSSLNYDGTTHSRLYLMRRNERLYARARCGYAPIVDCHPELTHLGV